MGALDVSATVNNMNDCDVQATPSRPRAVIFDVDGTLCDVRSVRHFVQGPSGGKKPKADFNKFHEASADCPPFEQVKHLALKAHRIGFAIVVVSGREAKWADLTAGWLMKNIIPWHELIMRQAGDYRPDHLVKTEIEIEITAKYEPVLAVDDRLDIISVWQAANIPTLQVDASGGTQRLITPPGATADAQLIDLLDGEGML